MLVSDLTIGKLGTFFKTLSNLLIKIFLSLNGNYWTKSITWIHWITDDNFFVQLLDEFTLEFIIDTIVNNKSFCINACLSVVN